jgi:hypothetical protein
MFNGFYDVALAFFEQTSSLIASCQVVKGDYIINPVKHPPIIFVYSTIIVLLFVAQLL